MSFAHSLRPEFGFPNGLFFYFCIVIVCNTLAVRPVLNYNAINNLLKQCPAEDQAMTC